MPRSPSRGPCSRSSTAPSSLHGAAGISDATPLAALWGWHRAMRIFDGPDEAHLTTLGRAEPDP
ncbi:acyl-CoA dehydrogenase family protein [Nocardioides convexus]|uniref:acyl-CoA dehydrogenase family protein n=1 Tax=Nocardioides convexus TaxID=2712224 RepID=UPI0024185C69|nr:acyl-CoA dehydrogenase family protein [Nocardioides convexus]